MSSTNHAVEQAFRRVEPLKDFTRLAARKWIEHTAASGLAAGRRSKTMPRWCTVGKHPHLLPPRAKLEAPGTYRFVWDDDRSVVFAVVRAHERDHQTGAGWVVMTVMTPGSVGSTNYRPNGFVS